MTTSPRSPQALVRRRHTGSRAAQPFRGCRVLRDVRDRPQPGMSGSRRRLPKPTSSPSREPRSHGYGAPPFVCVLFEPFCAHARVGNPMGPWRVMGAAQPFAGERCGAGTRPGAIRSEARPTRRGAAPRREDGPKNGNSSARRERPLLAWRLTHRGRGCREIGLREVLLVDRGNFAVLDGDPVLRLGAAVLVSEGLRPRIGERRSKILELSRQVLAAAAVAVDVRHAHIRSNGKVNRRRVGVAHVVVVLDALPLRSRRPRRLRGSPRRQSGTRQYRP